MWDAIVVYENISEPYTLRCRKGGLFFISGEPPIVKVYSQAFISLFDHVISAHNLKHPNNHRDQQALPWYFGYNFQTASPSYAYEEIEKMEVPEKKRKISFITSSRTFEYDYWTEKIADAILAYTVPIYCGCKNIDAYFPSEAMISLNINDEQGSIALINNVLNDSKRIYQEKLPFLKEARNRLLFKYNLFPFVKSYIDKYVDLDCDEYRSVLIKPYDTYPKDWIQDVLLKTKRVVCKIF